MSENQRLLQAFRCRLVKALRSDGAVQPLYALATDWGISLDLVKREGKAICLWQMLLVRVEELRRKGVSADYVAPPPATPGKPALADMLQELYFHSTSISAAEKHIEFLRSENKEIFALWDAYKPAT